jgi:hypothetical protein
MGYQGDHYGQESDANRKQTEQHMLVMRGQ